MDDRTPYELACNLEGQGLADYRNAKLKLRLKDPEFYVCPKCHIPNNGYFAADEKMCPGCKQAIRDAEIKAWNDAERKRREEKNSAGGLADKVQKHNDQKRSGAELAYRDDSND